MRTGIVIQARMNSRRFPAKMMADLNGYPVIEWVIRRSKQANLADIVILATSTNRENNMLVQKAEELGIAVFRGAEDDVLGRFAAAVEEFSLERIVRVCADNPVICPEEIDRLIAFFDEKSMDYAFNSVPAMGNGYPDGLGAEMVANKLLQTLAAKLDDPEEREHIFLHIWHNKKNYRIKTIHAPQKIAYPQLKFDVDTIEDLSRLQKMHFNIYDSSVEIVCKAIKLSLL